MMPFPDIKIDGDNKFPYVAGAVIAFAAGILGALINYRHRDELELARSAACTENAEEENACTGQ